ncbi:hypothetical protein Bbelb_329890 [Branchiostoma belcheri]|nr:hypothetical protein Bbelb_329890 [Branchiostoma belcheri]
MAMEVGVATRGRCTPGDRIAPRGDKQEKKLVPRGTAYVQELKKPSVVSRTVLYPERCRINEKKQFVRGGPRGNQGDQSLRLSLIPVCGRHVNPNSLQLKHSPLETPHFNHAAVCKQCWTQTDSPWARD